MARAAQGADVLVGILIDETVTDAGAAGHPHPVLEIIAAPGAATTAAGASGNLTGTFTHYVIFCAPSGRTDLGTGSTPLVLSAKIASLSVIPTSTSTEPGQFREIWRSDLVHTTPYYVGSIYDNTTTTFSDNIAADDANLDFNTTAPSLNQTGRNGGFVFLQEPEAPAIDADYVYIKSKGLTGGAGEPPAAPGDINIPATFKHALEAGIAGPVTAALLGKPTTVTNNADGTNQLDWNPSLSKFDACSLTILRSEGRPIRPEIFPQVVFSEIDGAVKGGALIEMAPKGMAAHHTLYGIPVITSSPNANYTTAPMLKGNNRADSVYETAGVTADLYVKVTTAASAGTMVVKFKRGSASSYGSTTVSVPYDTSAPKQQIQSGSNTSEWVECVDSNTGLRYGGDTGELRRPLMICFPGDISTIPLNSEWKFPANVNALIPGAGSTPGTPDSWYTGFPARHLAGYRFTSAHATLFFGEGALATPSTYLPSEDFKWKMVSGLKAVKPDGREAAHAVNFERTGYLGLQIDVESRYVSRRWKRYQEQDIRASVKLLLEGEAPLVQVGTRSANRLTYQVLSVQMRIDKTAVPIPGPDTLMNPTSFVAEQYPGQELFTVKIIDGRNRWAFR